MKALNHRLTLEMTVLNSQVSVHIKKNDTKNKLVVSLSENGKPYTITENMHAAFVGKKPDGKIVFNDCSIVGNTITYTITAQTSVVAGIVACEIRLYDTNDNLLTSPNFTIVVDETIYNADDIQIESGNEINVLDSLISEAKALIDEIPKIFTASYGITHFSEIAEAYTSGQKVFCIYLQTIATLTYFSAGEALFTYVSPGGIGTLRCGADNTWDNSFVAITNDADTSVFIAEYDVTAFEDIAAAVEDGKTVFCKVTENNTSVLIPLTHYNGTVARFYLTFGEQTQITEVTLRCYNIFVSSVCWDYDDFGNPMKINYGDSGTGASDAVQYIPQELTEEQQAQARANIGADASGAVVSAVSEHNVSDKAHNDIRIELKAVADRIAAVLDSDDTTLDELSEIVAYIKNNKSLIDSITTSKVSVSDIINNLTTNVTNKPLSAAQGVALKALIDAISIPTNVSSFNNDAGYIKESELNAAVDDALEEAKESGEFDGSRGNGILNITTAPSSYTTATGGFTPTYRIALSTVKTQSKASEVLIGDTLAYSYYHYPVGYVDSSYVYLGTRVSIRGATGSSVTVESVSESTEDGGSNVVTFSDNTTLTVKNGNKGKEGKTPVVGEDFWTPSDKMAMKADVIASIVTQEAGESESLVMSQKAVTDLVADALGTGGGGATTEYETVDSVEEMTDTLKQYVLKETGTLWAYGAFETGPQELYDTSKISVGYRHSSGTGGATTNGGETYLMTDYIPVDMSVSEPKLEVHGELNQQGDTAPSFYKIGYYNADKTCIGSKLIRYSTTNNASYIHTTNSNGVTTLCIGMSNGAKESYYSNIAFVRIDFVPTGSAATAANANVITSIINPDASGTTYMWYDTEIVPSASGGGGGNYVELLVKVNKNTTDIAEVSNRVTALETGSESVTVPTFWQNAVDTCIAKIKALQVGRNCVTFPFFSDNHQNNKGAGHLIAYVMKKCNIPYCFFGGDAISNGSDVTSEAIMIEQDSKFDQMMSVVPVEKMCRALGNHDAYWNPTPDSGSSTRVYYSREQIYDLFLRQESVSQNKHYGGDGTYYYVDDIASKTRFVVCNTNVNVNTTTEKLDDEQVDWLENEAMVFNESGWNLVFFSHQPITNHYHSNIYAETANAIQTLLTNYANGNGENKAEIVGWFSGHIHADRIYTGAATNTSDDSVKNTLPWKTITIRADHTGLCRDTALAHTPANDDQSHAIDFVTINKTTRTVNITRLGIGSDRMFNY